MRGIGGRREEGGGGGGGRNRQWTERGGQEEGVVRPIGIFLLEHVGRFII